MSNNLPKLDFDGMELRRLISAWCDGVIELPAFQRLQSLLTSHAQARLMYLEFMEIHSGVQGAIAAQQYLESFVPPTHLPGPPPATNLGQTPQILSFRSWRNWGGWLGHWGIWAAVLLIGFAGWTVTTAKRQSSLPSDGVAAIHPMVLAHVVEQSPDCQWNLDRGGDAPSLSGDALSGGETIRIGGGVMKLAYVNGTIVRLYGPALYQVISETRARMLLGKVTADVADKAKGFSILTPRATVVDLGTQFGINVSDVGSTDVVVFKGAVKVDFAATAEGASRQRRLRTGEAVHVDAQGTESRIISISNEWFSGHPDADPAHPPVITAVRDNIEREAWNYYQIVHAGMCEDAKAFVDRESHEWNGITTAGMPAYLLGGDYVKTFNNDKVIQNIEIRVTLGRPAKLYILFDDRIPAPPWLRDNFRNTSDHIGVDEGPFFSKGMWCADHQPGVGPGVSIDSSSAIWVREVKTPGTVVLGATEAPISGINMYGIVAVPADEDRRD